MYIKPEILAPAGSFECFKAAVNAGADAIYIGGNKYGARAYADNFDQNKLIEAIHFAHLHNVKVYLTTNTLIKNSELYEEYYNYLKPLYEEGLDAVIIQDIGLMSFVHNNFPDIDIHASTQSALFTHNSANELQKKFGITRVVPPRELSIEELRQLSKNTTLELEVFTHGALCYCVSGRCLMSSMNGKRSGNRGRCAQPCRHMYATTNNKSYLLSPKDLCTLENIGDLIEIGVDSFKIEGRMKKPEYVALCTSIYKKYSELFCELGKSKYDDFIKNNKSVYDKDLLMLNDIYNRGGFTSGYLHQHNGKNMMSLTRPNHNGTLVGHVTKCDKKTCTIKLCQDVNSHDILEIRGMSEKNTYEFTTKYSYVSGQNITTNISQGLKLSHNQKVYRTRNKSLIDEIDNKYIKSTKKIGVEIYFKCISGQTSQLTLSKQNYTVSVEGNIVEEAKNNIVDKARIEQQLLKLGNTDFFCTTINVECGENIFISMGEINALRRQAIEKMTLLLSGKYRRVSSDIISPYNKKLKNINHFGDNNCSEILHIATDSVSGIKSVCKCKKAQYIHFPLIMDEHTMKYFIETVSISNKIPVVILPEIIRYEYYSKIENQINKIYSIYPEVTYLCENLEAIKILSDLGIPKSRIITGPGLYVFNNSSKEVIENYSSSFVIPYELAMDEMIYDNYNSCIIKIFGKIPVMVSAQCVEKNTRGCSKKNNKNVIKDGKISYNYQCCCEWCYNVIYNNSIINYTAYTSGLKDKGINSFLFDFTDIDENTSSQIIDLINKSENITKFRLKTGEATYIQQGVL